jgi:hypothetical protein
MKHRDHYVRRNREHHPQVGIGLFFIVLGLALLVATNDMLHLGSVKEYFTWETAMIFVGVLLLVNLHFIPGLLLMAGGAWFMIDNFYGEIPALIKTVYWPAVIILTGLSFIISSFIKRKWRSY